MVDENIRAHYDLGLEETRLLIDGRPRLEYVRTLELLGRGPAGPTHRGCSTLAEPRAPTPRRWIR